MPQIPKKVRSMTPTAFLPSAVESSGGGGSEFVEVDDCSIGAGGH